MSQTVNIEMTFFKNSMSTMTIWQQNSSTRFCLIRIGVSASSPGYIFTHTWALMVRASILVNDNMVVKQMAYLAISVTENFVNNVTWNLAYQEITEVHANCIRDIILRTTELLTNKYPWVNNFQFLVVTEPIKMLRTQEQNYKFH
jgi:hypothetical protein